MNSSQLDKDFLDADLWEVEKTCEEIDKILKGDVDLDKLKEKEEYLEKKKEKERILKELKERERIEKLKNGTKGKGEGKNYAKFCMNCFIEYSIPEMEVCTHCHKTLITQEQRHKDLKEKLEVMKEKTKTKKFRRMKYENWLKSQGLIHPIDNSKFGPTNYTKWDLYESESDDENKDPILPRHDPQFLALEKQLNDDMKKRLADDKKSLELKEEGNKALKEKKYKKAIRLYSDAIDVCKRNMFLYTNRAFAYMKCEEWKNAIDDCDKVIEYFEVFEEEMHESVDIYVKALIRKSFCCEKTKDYDDAKDAIDKAKQYTKDNNQEVKNLSDTIEHSIKLYNESLKSLKIENDDKINLIKKFIELLKKGVKEDNKEIQDELLVNFENFINIIKNKNKELKDIKNEDNIYILYFNISGGIDLLFNFLRSETNNNSNLLTKLLELLNLISENDRYKPLINNIKGYNKLIQFLFTTESNESNKAKNKIAISLDQANIILGILESATLNDNCRNTITDINQLDNMADIVLKKYDISKIKDIPTSNLLSKTFTFICNICYSSVEIRSKISKKVSDVIYNQLNSFIENYNCMVEYHRNLLSSILSFLTNLSCDIEFRKNLSKERKFLKFLSENLLVELMRKELQMSDNDYSIDEIYEKVASLFYNLTFLNGMEKELIDYYLSIKIEAFIIYYVLHRFDFNNKNTITPLIRTIMLLFRIIKFYPDFINSQSKIPSKEELFDKLISFIDKKYIINNYNQIVEYDIKLFVYFIKGKSDLLNKNNLIDKLITNCTEFLIFDCGNNCEKMNEKNYERNVNLLSLMNSIGERYKEHLNLMKNAVPVVINICKDKIDLLRKNSALVLAKIASSSKELEAYVRQLHGFDVLVNLHGFLGV